MLEPEMALESSPDLLQPLCREAAELLKEAPSGKSPDLLAKHLAVPLQPTFSRREENLEWEDPVRVGRYRDDGNGRAGLIRQVVL